VISTTETIEEYHANEAIGSGDVRAFLRSPRAYADSRAGIGKKEKSAALSLGTLAHLYFLEPDKFDNSVVVKPPGHDGRTKEGKAWMEAMAGKTVMTKEDEEILGFLTRRMPAEVIRILKNTAVKAEVTYRAAIDGTECQCRADLVVIDGKPKVWDLKTCQDVDDAANSVWQYGYHIQAEWYKRVIHAETGHWPEFVFLFCETSSPYRWRIITLDDTLKVDADAKIDRALAGIAACRASGDWSDKSPLTQVVTAPKWATVSE
jgi:exodeoxyribonuclease VIII